MTTAREAVHNAALKGEELRTILLNNFAKLLENEGMLHSMAFGRVAYEIQLTLHLDNYLVPQSKSRITSRQIATNIVNGGAIDPITKEVSPPHPELGAIESFPLDSPSDDATLGALKLSHSIDSPNEERLRNDMPIPVLVQQQDGTKTIEHIKYPKEEMGEGNVTIQDNTRERKGELNMPDPAMAMESVKAAQNYGQVLCKCGYVRDAHSLAGISTQPQREGYPECKGFIRFDTPDAGPDAWPVEPT